MAKEQPRGGCFRCGNPHHSQWECHADLSQAQVRENRKMNHQSFYADNPEVKGARGATRFAKWEERIQCKSEASTVPWEVIMREVERLTDHFLRCLERLDNHHQIAPKFEEEFTQNKLRHAIQMRDDAKAEFGNCRAVLAYGQEKMKLLQRGEVQLSGDYLEEDIKRGKLAQLWDLRDDCQKKLDKLCYQAKNLHESVQDLESIISALLEWIFNFVRAVRQRPSATDLVALDRDLTAKRAQSLLLDERQKFIFEIYPGMPDVAESCAHVNKKLEEALAARVSLQNQPFFCPGCGRNSIEMAFGCGHGICRRCFEISASCPTCGFQI